MRYDPVEYGHAMVTRGQGMEGMSEMVGGLGGNTSRSRRSMSSSRGRRHAKLGSSFYTPTLAGEANRPRSVWDRLSQPSSFTGVYKRAYFTDGRMNAFSDTGASAIPTEFRGDTNTQSNETVHDISVMLRTNLKSGKTFR